MAKTHEDDLATAIIRTSGRTGRPVLAGVLAVILLVLLTILARSLIGDRSPLQGEHAWVLAGVLGCVIVLTITPRLRCRSGHDVEAAWAAPVAPFTSGDVSRAARRHRRFVPSRRTTTLHTREGRQIAARIVDLSMGGIAVRAEMSDLDFATVARVGSRDVAPVRRTDTRAVFRFAALLDPLDIHRDMAL